MTSSWAAFWAGEHSIYVSRRHLERHYHAVAQAMLAHVNNAAVIVDVGCGEALFANLVAARCQLLYLCESAPPVRERVRERWRGEPRITVVDETLAGIAEGAVDLLMVNSVVQYLSPATLSGNLDLWRGKLAPSGRLIIADVLPQRGSAAQEAASLLKFAAAERFFLQALTGLARTAFSKYPRMRKEIGLLRFDPAEMLALLADHGFAAKQIPNLGHNKARLAFLATPAAIGTSSSGAPQSSTPEQ